MKSELADAQSPHRQWRSKHHLFELFAVLNINIEKQIQYHNGQSKNTLETTQPTGVLGAFLFQLKRQLLRVDFC